MDLGLAGKVALVAGGSRGLGYAAAQALAREGARVAVFSRTEAAAQKAAEQLASETGSPTIGFGADVTRPEDSARAVREAVQKWGQLDVLITNSGGPPAGLFGELEDAAWQRAFDLLVLGVVRLVRAALPHLSRSSHARIVCLTSSAIKQPIDGLLLSNAVRIGVAGLAKSLAAELAPKGITINQVCPGRIGTDRVQELDEEMGKRAGTTAAQARTDYERTIPLGRYGRPEEIGAVVAFLASAQASYMTGTTLQVDGGLIRSVF